MLKHVGAIEKIGCLNNKMVHLLALHEFLPS